MNANPPERIIRRSQRRIEGLNNPTVSTAANTVWSEDLKGELKAVKHPKPHEALHGEGRSQRRIEGLSLPQVDNPPLVVGRFLAYAGCRNA